jgi:hypothetical protein
VNRIMKRSVLTTVIPSCLVACALALAACDKPAGTTDDPASKNAPAETTTAAATAPTTAATTTTVAIAESDLSTPADFEESAEKAITAKNYKTELKTLETEVAKE